MVCIHSDTKYDCCCGCNKKCEYYLRSISRTLSRVNKHSMGGGIGFSGPIQLPRIAVMTKLVSGNVGVGRSAVQWFAAKNSHFPVFLVTYT
jgi:hypothetical protein